MDVQSRVLSPIPTVTCSDIKDKTMVVNYVMSRGPLSIVSMHCLLLVGVFILLVLGIVIHCLPGICRDSCLGSR
jgi:hypothetical protein